MSKIDFSQIVTAEARELAAARMEAQAAARSYLADTDWYITRRLENGAPVPREVTEKRQAARAALSN